MALKKNIIANYLGQFYLIIIGIVVVPFYLQYLGEEAYGLVGFFALVQSWMLLLDMGISPTLSREVAKVKAKKNSDDVIKFKYLLHSLEFIFILISLFVAVNIIFFSDWISASWLKVETLDLNTVAYCISLIGVMIGLRFLTSLYKSGIIGTEEQVWLNKVNIAIATLKFVGVIFILHFISNDIKYFFEYQFFIAIIEFLFFTIKFYSSMKIGRFQFYFSYEKVKPILPFAMSIAYTGGIWIFITQLDKLLLSGILPLKEYGYFALLGMVANAIIQISAPISSAILPRMTNLYTQGKEREMLNIYRRSTQLVAIIVFAVTGVVSVYSFELLYSWTGNLEASLWGEDVLFWYVLANGILAIASFQYYLQFVYGKLKMHVRYHTVALFLFSPIIAFTAYTYGAIGVAFVWFIFMLLSFLLWIPYIHHLFAPGIHKLWMKEDVVPIFLSSIVYFIGMSFVSLDSIEHRGILFLVLILIGMGVLILNVLVSRVGREIVLNLLKKRK